MPQSERSTLELFASLTPDERATAISEASRASGLSEADVKAVLLADWRVTGRPKQQPPSGHWTYWWIRAGRGFGKLLDVDTPIPTPAGWTRLGDINVGDAVYDEAGRAIPVLETHDNMPEVAYRLRFSDGSHIDACSEHLWTTWTHAARKALGRSTDAGDALPPDWPTWRSRGGIGPEVRTTQQIVDTLAYNTRGDTNHSIPVCDPLDAPDATLPLDPYVLGAWLGDGGKHGATLFADVDDHPHWYRELAAFDPHPVKAPINIALGGGLHSTLGRMGLIRNKRVPAEYLRASPAQRLALLQGLMDTDGSAVASSVEFTNTNHNLVKAVVELARSLGQKPVVAEGRAMLNGKDCGAKWRVTWRPTVPVFRMLRKLERVKPLGGQAIRNRHRMILSAEPIEPVPMRCLTVGGQHRLFLAGEAMIPTHNTLSAAQWTKKMALRDAGCRIALVSITQADVRDTMVEGESGLLSILPAAALFGQSRESAWNQTKLELRLANGTRFKGFSSERPDRLRGPQHHHTWCEEVSSWKDAAKGDAMDTTWSNVKLSNRLGIHPQTVITSTPKANKLTKAIRDIPGIVTVTGSSYENRANLAESWWNEVVAPLEGTRTGRQEIHAEILEDVEGALWTAALLDSLRVTAAPPLARIVVGVDPNASADEAANAAGIVVAGVDGRGLMERHGYVLADRTIVRGGPRAWAQAAVDAYYEYKADRIVAEKNNGGEMVREMIRTVDPTVPIKLVWASRGKRTRAEPVASLYEGSKPENPEDDPIPGRVHHVGPLPLLEEEQTTWTPESESPDRMDAAVWALTELMIQGHAAKPMRSTVARGRLPGVDAARRR